MAEARIEIFLNFCISLSSNKQNQVFKFIWFRYKKILFNLYQLCLLSTLTKIFYPRSNSLSIESEWVPQKFAYTIKLKIAVCTKLSTVKWIFCYCHFTTRSPPPSHLSSCFFVYVHFFLCVHEEKKLFMTAWSRNVLWGTFEVNGKKHYLKLWKDLKELSWFEWRKNSNLKRSLWKFTFKFNVKTLWIYRAHKFSVLTSFIKRKLAIYSTHFFHSLHSISFLLLSLISHTIFYLESLTLAQCYVTLCRH